MLALIESTDDQGTPAWLQARAGCATASRFVDILATRKDGKEAAARRDYRAELVTERLTGIPTSAFSSKPMQWGKETEDHARSAYEMATGNLVIQVGYQQHQELEWCGASPDGLVGEEGMIEIKCPNPETHLKTVLLRSAALTKILMRESIEGRKVLVPDEHLPQIQGNLWVLNRKWCDFISYDPRFPGHIQLYVERVYRDEEYIAQLHTCVRVFLEEVETCVTQILGVTGAVAA